MRDKVKMLGFAIDKVSMNEAIEDFERLIQSDGLSIVVTANPEILNSAAENEELANVINSSDLVLADGMSLVLLSKIKKDPFPERVTGIDFAHAALEKIAEMDKSVYILGGKPGVAEQAADNLQKEIPALRIVGTCSGYFKDEEQDKIVKWINDSGAELLLAAMGSPKQELFLSRNKEKLKARLGVGIGGSLDVWSGNTKRAPEFYQRHNIEWLYRLKTEPERFGRMAKIPGFMLKVLFDK